MRHQAFVYVAALCVCAVTTSAKAQCGRPGPDLITGDIQGSANYSVVGSTDAFSFATTNCNVGSQNVLVIDTSTNHPIITQNMYRMKTVNGSVRFEQIGMSWATHMFTAITENLCCVCNGQGGSVLGVGCSTPQSTGMNGAQLTTTGGLGPRFEINAHTGGFIWPYTFRNTNGAVPVTFVTRRLQVNVGDLNPVLNSGATYFIEAIHVSPDDAGNVSQNDNASYRPVLIAYPGGAAGASASTSGVAVLEKAALQAWKASDDSVTETLITTSESTAGTTGSNDSGRAILAAKATDLGGGMWHYEYALYNANSHRSFDSFSIPVADGSFASNLEFHDVSYHSGDGYNSTPAAQVTFDGTDWTASTDCGNVHWDMVSASPIENSNALRWGTLYNFRFDMPAAPATGSAAIGYFRNLNGSIPSSDTLDAETIVPTFTDVDTDGIRDACDNCPDDVNPGQEDADSDGIGDACEIVASCMLEPATDSAAVNTEHTVVATVFQDAVPAPGVVVFFQVIAGPNAGVTDVGITNGLGQVDFQYFSNGVPGVDAISASGLIEGNPFLCFADVTWLPDSDSDGIPDEADNCPATSNPGQENSDSDGLGDACDNCAADFNPGQADCDADNVGDICDPSPNCAEPIIDGSLDDVYCTILATQNNQSGFGDSNLGDPALANGNELDGVYGTIQSGYLYLFLAGNLAHDRTKLDLFIDSQPGGQNRLLDGNSGHPLYVPLDRMGDDGSGNGLTFDTGFDPDYFIQVNADLQGGYSLYFDYVELGVGGDYYWLGTGDAATDGTLGGGDSPFPGLLCTIDNTNVAGVSGGSGVDDGAGVTTGVEFRIPLLAIGNPAGSIKVCALINGISQEYMSNQVLGGLGGLGNLGEPRTADFATIPGNQFFTVQPVSDVDTDGMIDCLDNCPNDFNPDQQNSDSDGLGDACDNCPATSNPGQEDCDSDAIGDACETSPPTRLYVDPDATGGNDGSSWADAFLELRGALTAANCPPGDGTVSEIWVADGIYKPAAPGGDRSKSFVMRSGLAIYGGFAGSEALLAQRNPAVNVATLSGDLSGNDAPVEFPFGPSYAENSYHVVTGSGTNATAILDGFVVRAGNANGGGVHSEGAGLLCLPGSPTITRCIFSDNTAVEWGGGVFLEGGSPRLTNCRFIGNEAGGFGGYGWGAGMAAFNAGGGGPEGNPKLTNCVFSGNTATGIGGGLFAGGSFPVLANCTFIGNTADGSGNTNSTPPGYGGGIWTTGSPTIKNTVLWGNTALHGGAQFYANGATLTVTHCNIQGGINGSNNVNPSGTQTIENNIDADPLFADPDGVDDVAGTEDDDLHILAGSPCIDAGSTPDVPADVADLDEDSDTSERTPFDVDGNKRLVDDPYTTDTGVPGSPVVDMGAYEYFPDCDNNGIDDADDIANDPGLDINPTDGIIDSCCFCASAGVWSNAATWNCGNVPINGTPSPGDRYNVNITCPVPAVTLDIPATIDSVVVEPGQALNVTGGDLTIDSAGGIKNDGSLIVGANQGIIANTSCPLKGASTYSMSAATASISSSSGAAVVTNRSTVAGQGVIDAAITNHSLGVIHANASSATLSVTGTNPKNNNGLMKATDDGILEVLDTVVAGTSGKYTVDGGTLRIVCSNPFLRGVGTSISGLQLDAANGGLVEVDGPVEINLSGPMTLDSLAIYQGAPSSSAVLTAGDLTINSTSTGGQAQFNSTMAAGLGRLSVIGCGALRGCTPPVLGIHGDSSMDVGDDLHLEGFPEVSVDSTQPVQLGGDFDNRATDSSEFDWPGQLTMDGAAPQTFELAGIDYGPSNAAGFVDNFEMGTLRIETGRTVDMVNTFDNLDGPGCEALYVQTLELGVNSTLRLQGCNVYYDTLNADPSATIQKLGGALFLSIHVGDLDDSGGVDLTDVTMLANYLVYPTGPGCNPICQFRADVNGDGAVNALDIQLMIRILTGW